jgi:DNA-binding response OmpR family regulator
VLLAANGQDGLSLFSSNSVDAVLLDYHLPGDRHDGLQIGLQMKLSKPHVPIAIFTADTDATECAFADLFLQKPTEPDELLRQIAILAQR